MHQSKTSSFATRAGLFNSTRLPSLENRRQPDVPHDIGENPAASATFVRRSICGDRNSSKRPLRASRLQQWDWHANVDSGIAVYHEDLAGAKQWRQAEQVRLSGQLTAVLQIVNRQRALRGMKRLVRAPLRIPSLTTAQIEREAIRSYNGENEYHFNLQYVDSAIISW